MSTNESKFDIWWNSPETKQKIGAAYSLGASVVIIGAMFKILHLDYASTMLGIGMSVEAFIFALGIFDKPLKDYEWDKVYDFEGNSTVKSTTENVVQKTVVTPTRSVGLNYSETISDEDVKKLSEGIKNLTVTAQQFSGLSDVMGATEKFVKNIDGATQVTGKFVQNQESLNASTSLLGTSYQGITDGMQIVDKNTKLFAGKVDEINKNLASINSIYEIQLKNIQSQTESLNLQNDSLKAVNSGLNLIIDDVQKIKSAASSAVIETESFKNNTTKLSKQVADLNLVYGNMLNSLS